MEAHSNEFPVKSMAKLLGVSRSGYYKYLKICKSEIYKYDINILETINNNITAVDDTMNIIIRSGKNQTLFKSLHKDQVVPLQIKLVKYNISGIVFKSVIIVILLSSIPSFLHSLYIIIKSFSVHVSTGKFLTL